MENPFRLHRCGRFSGFFFLKSVRSAFVGLVFFGGSYALCSAQKSTAQLKWISGPSLNLGDISFARGTEASFVFENTDSDSLTIETVRTSCSCTAVNWPEKPIAPGEKVSLTVRFSPNTPGRFSKTMPMYFLERKKAVRLKMKGNSVSD